MKLTKEHREIIERIGVFFERKGTQPILGRIIGLLLVLDKAEATFDEIQEALSVSKSAVSQALNLLQSQNRVEYITKPGERKRYFRLRIRSWRQEMQEDMNKIFKIKSLMEEILTLRNDENKEFNQHLKDLTKFISYMQEELPKLVAKYDQQQS